MTMKNRHCLDGGVCHHDCGPFPMPCFRQRNCLPLSSSGWNDQWEYVGSTERAQRKAEETPA